MNPISSPSDSSLSGELKYSDLLTVFKPSRSGQELIGLELEKFAVTDSGAPLPISGPRSVRSILEALAVSYGWKPEYDGEWIIALQKEGDAISVEPGGQLELSTAPGVTLDRAAASERNHLKDLSEITRGWGVTWCGAGMHPTAALNDVGWIGKTRYSIMRDYLAGRGDLAHYMMKMTASLQVSVDHTDETDAAKKLAVAARLTPILTAICAASPILEGRPVGFQSYRSHIWTRTDPARCGLPDCFFLPNFRFEDYAEYALDVPLFFIERPEGFIKTGGLTFREFLRSGAGGHQARLEDWRKHLTFLFPEVRLKHYIEIRCCDRQPGNLSFGAAALIKGLLYSKETLAEAAAWLGGLTAADCRDGLAEAARSGRNGTLAGKKLDGWMVEAMALGSRGLERLKAAGRSSDLETLCFKDLERLVLDERASVSDRFLAALARGESPIGLMSLS